MNRGPVSLAIACVLVFWAGAAVILAQSSTSGSEFSPKPDFDARLVQTAGGTPSPSLRTPTVLQLAAAEKLAREVPGLTLRWDGMSGSPRWIAGPPGTSLFLPSPGPPEKIARNLLGTHAALFGLTPREMDELQLSSIVPSAGGIHIHFDQKAYGFRVLGGGANVNLNLDGSVRSLGSHLYANIPPPGFPNISAGESARLAAFDVYPDRLFDGQFVFSQTNGEWRTVFSKGSFGREPTARLALLPERVGARLVWEVEIAEPTLATDFSVLVDAQTGEILGRKNRTLRASARVILDESPEPNSEEVAPANHVLATIPSTTPESPAGWITGTGTTLAGNNATTHLRFFSEAGLAQPSGMYDYPFSTLEAAAVNAWWWSNDFHDRLYAIGFDEASGNFQQDNFGLGGRGGDPMGIVIQGEQPRTGNYFDPAIDGTAGHINLQWNLCRLCGDHDGLPENGGERHVAFDRGFLHEYTHGMTTRLVGGPDQYICLLYGAQSGAIGEGLSEVFPPGIYGTPRSAGYLLDGFGFGDARNDFAYGDFCKVANGICEAHSDGSIWAGTLWDIRESMVALDPQAGADKFNRVLVESLKEMVCYPDFLDGRDALLSADGALYSSAHLQVMWNVFAARGMGQGASTSGGSDTNPVPSSTVPTAFSCTPPGAPLSLTAAADGPKAIRLNFSASGARSVEIWREDSENPLDRPERIAFTTSTTTFFDTTVQGGRTYRYHVVALGGGGVVCRSAASGTADARATGPCQAFPIFDPQLRITDGSGDCSVTLSWSAAAQGCPDEPADIVYNVYRAALPGFEPFPSALIGRTTGTSFQDIPPQDGTTCYYFVLAQHGSLDDPPEAHDRGSSQALRWVPRIPTLGRTTVGFWDFDSGPGEWTVDNTNDPTGGWVLVTPHPTRWGQTFFNPNLPAGGSGMSWVTGDAEGATALSNDCDGVAQLISPVWDGTGGATILSFDYWHGVQVYEGIQIKVDNGTTTAVIAPFHLQGTQPFDTDTERGWQRAEIDLATAITPTTTMTVTFYSVPITALSEYGIDNVRIEQATPCSRSALKIAGIAIDDAPAGWGNADGVFDPGETARLQVTLTNNGTAAAQSPAGVVTALTPGVPVHESLDQFPDIEPAGTGTSLGRGFTLTAPTSLGCGETLVLDFAFSDAAGVNARELFSLELGRKVTDTLFEDTFETDQGWTVTGLAGKGIWQRGDPVGTKAGGKQANPENDSPRDSGTRCYVTENGAVGGAAADTDVDFISAPSLESPEFDLTGYKRARASYDLWYFDNSASAPTQDYGSWFMSTAGETLATQRQYGSTSGWMEVTTNLVLPMVPANTLTFLAYDNSPDSIVEMGIDNFKIEADRQVCTASSVTKSPNGVGDSVRVTRPDILLLSWSAPPVDAGHDAAAFYRVFVSGQPQGGFAVADTTTALYNAPAATPTTEFYLISAVNASGPSHDEPSP